MSIRRIVFWMHLTAGVCAGLIIFTMSVTGVLLTYERQMLAWADSGFRSTVPSAPTDRLPLETIVERIRAARVTQLSGITVRTATDAPIVVTGRRTLFVDAYTGAVIGEASRTGVRAVMTSLREWHRWLALSADRRATGRAITGWSSLIFLGIICSGMYLWLPRRWAWQNVRAVLVFRGGLAGKARDFNWHNAIGIWSAVPLFIVVLTALPIAFPWANAAVYRLVGEAPPAPAAPVQQPAAAAETRVTTVMPAAGLDRAFATAAGQISGWQSATVRLPATKGAYAFVVDRGDGGQPHLRDTLTIGGSGEIIRSEPFASQTLGRRLRSLSRFAHTGEVLGLVGQTIAGIASTGAVFLVWTGLALATRRLFGSRPVVGRERDDESAEEDAA